MVLHPLTQDHAFNCRLDLLRPCLPPSRLGSVQVGAREAWQFTNMGVVVVEQEDCGDRWKEGLGSAK